MLFFSFFFPLDRGGYIVAERSLDLNRRHSTVTIVYMFKKIAGKCRKRRGGGNNHPLADDQVRVETEQQVSERQELPARCCDSAEVLK